MIFDTLLQKILIEASKLHKKDIMQLDTNEISNTFLKYVNKYVSTPITINNDVNIKIIDIILRAGVTAKHNSVNILDFIRAWNIIANNTAFNSDIIWKKGKELVNPYEINNLPLINMNKNIENYDPVFGRNDIIEQITNILMRKKKGSALLVGSPGTGKTAIVQELVYRIEKGMIPFLKDYQVYQCEANLLKTLASSPMSIGKIYEILNIATKRVILFIDEFHNLCPHENVVSFQPSVIELMKPALASGDIQIIGATTEKEAKKYIEHDKALMRRIQTVAIKELEKPVVQDILANILPVYEEYHQTKVLNESEVINFIIDYSDRYISERWEPDRSIDILDEGLAFASSKRNIIKNEIDKNLEIKILRAIANDKKDEAKELLSQINTQSEITDINSRKMIFASLNDFKIVLAKKANIDLDLISLRDLDRIKIIEHEFNNKIIGQKKAVKTFISAIKKFKTGLANPNRPISILMVGPTGTGKTEISKRAAEILFDKRKDSFIRLDMTEFSAPHSTATLIGSPPGYVNSDQGGKLTEMVAKNPYSIILLDELEKAHQNVLNILLQVLDDGVLTDAMGKKVNFKNCIIVMTTNAGMDEVIEKHNHKNVGFTNSNEDNLDISTKEMKEHLKNYYRPEFINRIDSICIFNYFTDEEITIIIKKEIEYALARIPNYHVKTSDRIIQNIKDDYYSKEYGARSIKRGIEELIINQIADKIIDNPEIKEFEIN